MQHSKAKVYFSMGKRKVASAFVLALLLISVFAPLIKFPEIATVKASAAVFGNDVIGTYGDYDTVTQGTYGHNASLPETGYISNIGAYFSATSGTVNAKAVIYFTNGTLAGESNELTGIDTTPAVHNFPCSDFELLAGSYVLLFQANAATKFRYDMDYGGGSVDIWGHTYGAAWDNPASIEVLGGGAYGFTIFANYSTTPPTGGSFADMKLSVVGNELQMPNNTRVILKGVDKGYHFADDPDGYWGSSTMWDNSSVEAELDLIAALGCNFIRMPISCNDFQTNATDGYSAIGQKLAVNWFTQMCGVRGIWVQYCPLRAADYVTTNNTVSEDAPYLPYTNDTVFHNADEFISWYGTDFATYLAGLDYGNVVVGIFNEPGIWGALPIAEWLNVSDYCVDAARTAGYDGVVIVGWSGQSVNKFLDVSFDNATNLAWIDNATTTITDTENNLAFTMHVYRFIYYESSPVFRYCYNYEEMTEGFYRLLIYNYSQIVPLIFDEIGADLDKASWDGWVEEEAWYNNTLTLADNYGIGYAGWWWRNILGMRLLVDSTFELTESGAILFAHIGTGYNITIDSTANGEAGINVHNSIYNATPALGQHLRVNGYNQSLVAIPDAGYDFINWTITFDNSTVVELTDEFSYVVVDQEFTAKAYFLADTYTLSLSITNPQNTTYTETTVAVQLSTTGNDTNPVVTYNVQWSNGSWLYVSNQTFSGNTTMTASEDDTYTFYGWVVGDNNASDTENVMFTVAIAAPETAYEIEMYISFFVLALVMTVLGIIRKTPVLYGIAGVAWITLAIMHLGIAPIGSTVQLAPVVLYFGVGILFMPTMTLYTTFRMVYDAIKGRSQRNMEREDDIGPV